MTKKLTDLTEVTTTEDGDLLLIRDATDGVDKKMQAQNLRAKATTKDDVGLSNVPDLDTTDAVNKAHDQNTDSALDQGGLNEVTAADARAHIDSTDNPHGVTKTQVGLGDVDNVSAADLRDRSTHTGTQDATTVNYDNASSGLSATDVQGAIDEVASTSSADAGDVTYDNTTSGLSATDVQAAIDELEAETVSQTSGTGAAKLPSGTTGERPADPVAGMIRFNTDNNQFEAYNTLIDDWSQTTDFVPPAASFTWDSATTDPAGTGEVPQLVIDNLYNNIRGCTLLDNGTVNYYLNASDWSTKDGGGASDLTGADGQVMVEIPAFYYRVTRSGTQTTWEISYVPQSGFSLHPAFILDGVEVSHRYYSAYDACVFDDSASAYISGTNLDNATGLVDTGADKLASVKGIYPMVGLTRNEFRLLAANRGSGWRQLDFPLWCAVGMLYVIEYQTFYNQDELGDGNTNGNYVSSSSNQSDSPHTIAGAGDSWGNGSTDGSQPSAGDKVGTAYMKYRGIENQFGNGWNWADAINVNVSATGNVHIADDNDRANYADDTATNHTLVTSSLTTGSDNISEFLPVDPYFLAESVGGSDSQYITDSHFGSSSKKRIVFVGGSATLGGSAGMFALGLSGFDIGRRFIGGRLCR